VLSVFKKNNFPSGKEINILLIKKKNPMEGQIQRESCMCELLGNKKFWTVLPDGFLISRSEQVLVCP